MSDYPAGTVAVATVRGVPNVRVFRTTFNDWSTAGNVKDWTLHGDLFVTDVRPLAVLDLDPTIVTEELGARRNEAQRLVDMLRETADNFFTPGAAALARKVADQIEAQTKPPRIPEPKGLGAVVEDYEHRLWIRHSNTPGTFPWICEGVGARGWSEIDAVRVLSEGVDR